MPRGKKKKKDKHLKIKFFMNGKKMKTWTR